MEIIGIGRYTGGIATVILTQRYYSCTPCPSNIDTEVFIDENENDDDENGGSVENLGCGMKGIHIKGYRVKKTY